MEKYWLAFYIGLGIFSAVGILSGILTNPIKKATQELEHYANGKVTHHHSYIPYD